MDESCNYCQLSIPGWVSRCPHCARPSLFPNVAAAGEASERAALSVRYQHAVDDATSRGVLAEVVRFEQAMSSSVGVVSRSVIDVMKLAASGNEVYSTYYQQVETGLRLPASNGWDTIRALVDSALFPHYKSEVRFGCLSLDGAGVSYFGPCTMVLKTELVEYRTSVYEENSVLFFEKQNVLIGDAGKLPKGYRSVWGDRARHAVAKLFARIDESSSEAHYQKLLVRENAKDSHADFLEIHIFGPMTLRTIRRVIVHGKLTRAERRMLPALREKLETSGVEMEIV